MPASLEKRPRATPKRMASRTVMPAAAPPTACGLNAPMKIEAIAPGRFLILIIRRMMLPTM